MALPANSLLFREYIGTDGPKKSRARFPVVPINEKVQFHFIVSSAIDYDTATSPPVATNGQFSPYWNLINLSVEKVASIKQNHPNVKVILSLGGDTAESSGGDAVKSSGGDTEKSTPVTFIIPSDVDIWVENAYDSLKGIIDKYKFDGIDINYMHFIEDAAGPGIFSECIGGLLKRFKKENGTSFITSIAPSTDGLVQSYYSALWLHAYGKCNIDYVNFKFYTTDPPINSVDQFLANFHTQSSKYNNGKVLASITSGSGSGSGGLTADNWFWDACNSLKDGKELYGIFIWSADLSLERKDNFDYERHAQDLLANGNNLNN